MVGLKPLNIIAGLGIIINISLNLLLIPKWGSEGASFASALTQFFILISQIFTFVIDISILLLIKKSSLQIIFSTAFLIGAILFQINSL